MYFPFPRHDRTAHVRLDAHACQSCGACVDACPRGVLSLLPYAFHHHAHVDHADRCRGCLRCVRTCQKAAVQPLSPPRPRARPPTAPPSLG